MKGLLARAALLLLAPATAQAVSCTASASGVVFGTYVPSSSPKSVTGTVTVKCSNSSAATVSYTIALNAGTNSGGSFSNRQMNQSTSQLAYQLYSNSGHTTVWGDGTGGTSTVSGTCSITSTTCSSSKTVYGRIPALQAPSPGSYTDSVLAIVTY